MQDTSRSTENSSGPEPRATVPGLVSVVTAAYNMAGYVAETIDSVLAQDYPQIESIVVDDGSTDDTPAVLARYQDDPRVRIVRQENDGQTKTKNRGVAAARGEFVAFCDADDTWQPHKLSRQIPHFADPKVGVVYSDIECIDAEGGALPYYDIPHYSGHVTAQLLLDNFVPFPTAVARTDLVRRMGGFDENLTMSIDYDLWLRISVDHDFFFVPERLANYRVWAGQMSLKEGERLDNFFRLLDRFIERYPHAVSRRDVDQAYAHVHVTRGFWHARNGRNADAWRDYRRAAGRHLFDERLWRRMIALLLRREKGRKVRPI